MPTNVGPNKISKDNNNNGIIIETSYLTISGIIINNQINKIYDNVILVFDIQGYNFNIKTYDNASNDELDNYKYFIQHYIENS